ncbi:MAG: thioredoxin domain-containing protein, partial [Planctomycetota bacterium]
MHAHNPVDWFPWGPEAFAKAKKENKLIFLSIGYTSCHWCHVMERLVFSNAEIAKYMNENFVCVKVDREERPDIDDIYMTALSVYFRLSGSDQNGGWPLSMFMTAEGKPIAGGTYFPPEDSEGRKGFPTVMKIIADLWRNDSETLEKNAEAITTNVRRVMSAKIVVQDTPLTAELAAATVKHLADTHDAKFGGFDFNPARANAPKFPVPSKLALLLYAANRDKDDALRAKLTFTLDAMAAGGIRDHLAGGFHRYSTDRAWKVPHFEKMLYDNAQLADVYVEAFRQTKDPAYKLIAEEMEMTDKRGGFFSALDADSEDVEGKSYVWSEREIDQLLGPNAEAFKLAYGLNEKNTFEVGYVLHQPQPLDQVAAKLKLSPADLEKRLSSSKQKLLTARNRRPQPLTDDKVLTGWNGLMIKALSNAGAQLDRADYLSAAERAAMFVVTELRDEDGRLHRSYRGAASPIKAYLDDYTYLVDGLIALHLATREPKWLNAASKLTDDQLKLFWDEQNSGFFFTATDHEELLARSKDRYDSVVPSGNSVAVRNLLRLAALTKNVSYREKAELTLKAAAGSMQDSPGGFANMALALF